jgi:hypothetical protein
MSGSPHAFNIRPAETTGETSDACEADAGDFDGFAVKHVHSCVIKNFANRYNGSEFH